MQPGVLLREAIHLQRMLLVHQREDSCYLQRGGEVAVEAGGSGLTPSSAETKWSKVLSFYADTNKGRSTEVRVELRQLSESQLGH